MKTGIVSYGVAMPYYRLCVDEIVELWMNSSMDLIKKSQGVLERGVLGLDEDSNTLAVGAAREAIDRLLKTCDIEALYLGTCTNPYDSRPSSTMILEALDLPYHTRCCDLQFSTKSGTSAITQGIMAVEAGMAEYALAVGADTINRHTAPGDLVEPYASAGAGAFILGKENLIAQIDAAESFSSDLSDGFRIEGERYLRSGMLLGSAKNEVGLDAHMTGAVRALFEKNGMSVSDFRYVVFQQNTPGTARHCAKLIGVTNEQYQPSIYADQLGDTGSASPLIGLAQVLDIAEEGDKILVCSYGYGAGADAIALTVTSGIKKLPDCGGTVKQHLAHKEMVDYKKAIKMEYKYLRHSYPLNAYL